MATKAKSKERYAVLANKSYGLYCGIVESFDPATGVAVVRECRHIAYWCGKIGGITSLAKWGICGPNAANSRIGGPVAATLTGVVNVFECSSEARATFEASSQL
jgi:hypothetical protein